MRLVRAYLHTKQLRKPVNIKGHRDHEILALAWFCTSTPTQTQFILGARVEKIGRTFFEGAWDGPVEKVAFRQNDNFFGTGCSFRKYLVFTPLRHRFDAIYAATSNGITYTDCFTPT